MQRAVQVLGSSLRKPEKESEEESASPDSHNPIAGEKVLLQGFFFKIPLRRSHFQHVLLFPLTQQRTETKVCAMTCPQTCNIRNEGSKGEERRDNLLLSFLKSPLVNPLTRAKYLEKE